MAGRSGRRRSSKRAADTESRSRWETIPVWIQAIAALGALALGVAGVTIFANRERNGEPLPGAEVSVIRVSVGEAGIAVEGEYRRLRSGREVIVLMGHPEGSGAEDWTHVEADLLPTRVDSDAGIEDGEWEARIPVEVTQEWVIQPAVVRGGSSGVTADDEEELRREGPDAEAVTATGEARTVSLEPEP